MNTVIKRYKMGVIIVLTMVLLIGCSVTHSVKTSSTSALTKELKEEIPAIKNIKYTFTRPNLTITIKLDSLTEEKEASLVDKVKQFSSIENINEISESVNWNIEISNIYLIIEHASEDAHLKYYASYFKTNDASNTSEENIDGYQTWSKSE